MCSMTRLFFVIEDELAWQIRPTTNHLQSHAEIRVAVNTQQATTFPSMETADVPCVAAVDGSGASWLAVLCNSSAASRSSMMLLFSSSVAGDILLWACWAPVDLALPPDRPGLPPLTASLHHMAQSGYLLGNTQRHQIEGHSAVCVLGP